jgi:multidrug transporter EmrE-like cation transporter
MALVGWMKVFLMTVRLFLLIFVSVSLSALAQLALKVGTTAAASARSSGVGGEMGGLLHSPMVFVGLGLYGIGAILWLFVLGRAPLSLAYPFVGIGFILTMLAGAFFLNENLTFARVAGTLLIAVGCVLVARSA